MKYLSLLIWLLTAGVYGQIHGCPPTCTCDKKPGLVTCDPGLTEFPTAIPVGSVSLFLQGTEKETNSITSLTEDKFKALGNLTALYVTYSQVRTIDVDAFQGLTKLLRLDLSNNEIRMIEKGTFDKLEKLLYLDLSGNKHIYLDASVLLKLINLEQLYLSQVGWKRLDKTVFRGLTSLQLLDLSDNSIRKIYPDMFKDQSHLTSFRISGNHLRGLPVELHQTFQSLTVAHLSGNPWQCNCELAWLKNMTSFIFNPHEPDESVMCSGPKELQFQSLHGVDPADMHCVAPSIQNCHPVSEPVKENNDANISCDIGGDPFPEITWFRPDGKTFSSDEDVPVSGYHLDESGALLISEATKADDGVWKIVAKNARGRKEFTVSLNVALKKETTNKPSKEFTVLSDIAPKKETTSKSSDNMPIIIGGACGGGAALVGLIVSVYIVKRMKKNKVNSAPDDSA